MIGSIAAELSLLVGSGECKGMEEQDENKVIAGEVGY